MLAAQLPVTTMTWWGFGKSKVANGKVTSDTKLMNMPKRFVWCTRPSYSHDYGHNGSTKQDLSAWRRSGHYGPV